jgi:hypothetical protein
VDTEGQVVEYLRVARDSVDESGGVQKPRSS